MTLFAMISPMFSGLGVASLWLVEASYLPQLWRLYRMKEADEFSFLFPGLNILGRLAGLAMSVSQGSQVFGWFFFTGIVLRMALLGEVIYYRTRSKRIQAREEQLRRGVSGELGAVGAP